MSPCSLQSSEAVEPFVPWFSAHVSAVFPLTAAPRSAPAASRTSTTCRCPPRAAPMRAVTPALDALDMMTLCKMASSMDSHCDSLTSPQNQQSNYIRIIMVQSCSHQHLFWGEPGNKREDQRKSCTRQVRFRCLAVAGKLGKEMVSPRKHDKGISLEVTWTDMNWHELTWTDMNWFQLIAMYCCYLWDLVRLMNLQNPFAELWPHALAPAQPQRGHFAPRSAVATNGQQRMPGTARDQRVLWWKQRWQPWTIRVVDQVISQCENFDGFWMSSCCTEKGMFLHPWLPLLYWDLLQQHLQWNLGRTHWAVVQYMLFPLLVSKWFWRIRQKWGLKITIRYWTVNL